MTPELLKYLADPFDGKPLELKVAARTHDGQIHAGELVGTSRSYPILDGVPRFVESAQLRSTVTSFGDEWNHFNFDRFKQHWVEHTVRNTWDASPDVFKGKLVVDAGAGSGAQSLWALQSGARHVIALELSHAVDGVIRKNLESSGFRNYDIVQCSIDAPPLRAKSIAGIVICHNVIQHTPSIERTAKALFATVAPGGEFVFNAYSQNDGTPLRWIRDHLVYRPLREVLRRAPFLVRLGYSHSMGVLRLAPGIGWFLEKAGVCVCGVVPASGSQLEDMRRRHDVTVLNTFDYFGGHAYQHHPSDDEIRELVRELQPETSKVLNLERYFTPPPRAPGCALRVLA